MIFIVILLILIFFSACFSSLETGLLALGRIKAEKWAGSGRSAGGGMKLLNVWLSKPAEIITSILVGNNIVNISFSTLITVLIVRININFSSVEYISIILSSVVLLTAGEIIPKTFANTYPEKVVKWFFNPFMKFYVVSEIVVNILNKVAFYILRIDNTKGEEIISRKEIKMAIEEMESITDREYSTANGHSAFMLGRVLLFSQKTVKEVMTHRRKLEAVDINWENEKIIEFLLKSPYSRILVYEEKIDELKGLIYIKDVVDSLSKSRQIDFNKILRKVYTTVPNRNCRRLFQELRIHYAVVQSRGRVEGIVTIEDLLEEIVGEIYDEYDLRGCK